MAAARLAPREHASESWKVETLEPKLLLSADAMPGVHRIDGAIDQPGEQDRFQFTLTEQTRFLFDGVQGAQVRWQLQGPNATDQFSFRSLESTGDRFVDLNPGTYNLTVDGVGDRTGNYVFQLIGIEASSSVRNGVPVTGQLASGTQAALYSVNLEVGDRLYVQPAASNTGGSFTLFDPQAVSVWAGVSLTSDSGVFTAARSGTYWMSVEGSTGAIAALDYGFTLWRNPARKLDLALGQAMSVALTQPGDAVEYRFSVDRATQVQWDQLTAPQSGLVWDVRRADTDSPVGTGSLNSQDGQAGPMQLAAGAYVLRLQSQNRAVGAVGFRLLWAASAQAVSSGANLPVPADVSLGGQVVRVEASGAQQLSLAHEALADSVNAADSISTAGELLVAIGASKNLALALGGTAAGVLDVALTRLLVASGDQLDIALPAGGPAWALRLFDAAGRELAVSTTGRLKYTASAAGLVYLGVSTVANTGYSPAISPSAGATSPVTRADLTVKRTPGAGYAAAIEPPDSLGQANDLLLASGASTTVAMQIGDGPFPARDVDFFRMVLVAGEVLKVSTPNGPGFDGFLQVFDEAGSQVTYTDDTPLSFTVQRTGVYALGFSAYGNRSFNPLVAGSGNDAPTGSLNLTVERARNVAPNSATWVVTDAIGVRLGNGNLTVGQIATVSLPQSGSYYVWTDANFNNTTQRGQLRLAAWTPAAPSTAVAAADAALQYSRSLDYSGQVVATDISVAVGGTWVFEPSSAVDGAQWRLSGLRGTEFDWTALSSQRGTSAPARYLAPGSYRLELRSTGLATGLVGVTLTPYSGAASAVVGGDNALPDLAIGQSTLLRLDATPGDRFVLTLSALATDFSVQANDAYGRALTVMAGNSITQGAASGPVFLRLLRQARSGDAAITLRATRTAATPVTPPTAVAIRLGAEVNDPNTGVAAPVYKFTQAADGWVALEWQEGNWTQWRLDGPRGNEATGSFRESFYNGRNRSWQAPVRWLPAGEYSLALSGGNGLARFSLRDAGRSNPVATNTAVSVDLASNDAYELFDLRLRADLKTYLRGISGAGADNWFRLYDAGGVLLTEGDPASTTPVALTVPRDGRYLLAISRNTFSAGSTALRFELPTAPLTPPAVSLGDTIGGRFLLTYDTRDFSLNLNSASQLRLDTVSTSGSAKTYQLLDANGSAVEVLSYGDTQSWALAAGRYTLRVQRSDYYTTPGADDRFSATLTALAAPRTVTLGGSLDLAFSNGLATGMVSFTAEAGSTYTFSTATAPTYDRGYRVRVFDSSGAQVL